MPSRAGAQTTNPVPPEIALRQMLIGYRISQAIYVAAKLGIADLLKDGPKSSDELAASVEANPDALHRLLRVLASVGVFAEVGQRSFTLTPMGAFLQRGVPGSVWGIAVLTGEWWWRAYEGLLYCVKTGKPAHDHVYGKGVFEYFDQHPDAGEMFHAGNTAMMTQTSSAVVAAYDFSGIDSIIDVGGGNGNLIAAVLKANPTMRGVIFELPYIIDDARGFVETEGVADRCELVAGDFFQQSVPSGGDAYIHRYVIHSFDDERAVLVLKNCHRAMQGQGKLLVVEQVMPARVLQAPEKILWDLERLAMTGGRERTEAEFRALLSAAGFKLTKVVPTRSGVSIIEGVPV